MSIGSGMLRRLAMWQRPPGNLVLETNVVTISLRGVHEVILRLPS